MLTQEEVASKRGLKTSTVMSHMAEAVKVGLPVDVQSLGVTSSIQQLVTKAIRGDVIKSGMIGESLFPTTNDLLKRSYFFMS